jgi:hypothetical protein
MPQRRATRTLQLEALEDRLALCCYVNPNPVILPIPQQAVAPGSSGSPIALIISDPAGDPGSVVVTAAVTAANPIGTLNNFDVLVGSNGSGPTVQIFDPENIIGTATVTLTAYDECTGLSGQTSFPVVVDSAPSLILPNGTSFSQPHTQFPITFPVVGGSSVNAPVTVTGVSDYSLLFSLQQQYGFTGIGYGSAGPTAYVLQSNVPGPGVSGYYLIRPTDGALFPYDGSGNYDSILSGAPLAVLGANVFTDPNLLLNAQPPVDYTALHALQQQYQFTGLGYLTADTTDYVFQSATGNNSFGNPYYLLTPTGGLYAYDGSGSYAHSISNGTAIANLDPNIYSYPSELTNAEASPAIYDTLSSVQQQYDLQECQGSFYVNTYGNQAEWFYSPILNQFGQNWYTLTLQTINNTQEAVLTAWNGYQNSESGAVVATLDPSVYSNPQWLINATALPEPSVTQSVNNSGTLTVGLPNSNFVGTFRVMVTASDGLLSTTQYVTVTATDTAPAITVSNNGSTIPQGGNQSFPAGSFPQTDTVAVTDAGGGTLTSTASVSTYDPAFTLEQRYQFQGLGDMTFGAPAYVLNANSNNSYGNNYFLLSPTGGVYPYDGSGSYAHTFANVAPLANLGSIYFDDPSLLFNAQPAVNYSQLYNLQLQYGFQALGVLTADATADVLQADANNSFGNPYYLLSPAGGLYAYDGSGSYAHTFANVTPIATLDPSVYANPALLTGALASPGLYSQLLAVEQQYDLTGIAYLVAGSPAYVLSSPINNANGNPYYLLNTNGNLYAYDGSGSYTQTFSNSANVVATLDPSIYGNPTLLTSAKSPVVATGVRASLVNGTLTLNAPSTFVGTFQVTVTATDGSLSSSQTFSVSSTDTPALPNSIAPLTISRTNPVVMLTLSSTGSQGKTVTYSATGEAYSPEYTLEQDYRFQGLGRVTTADGVTAYMLQVAGLNANGNPYYLLSNTGGLYAYDGSGSFSHTIANSANLVAQLNPIDFADPSLLIDAQAPITSSAIAQAVNPPSGNQLSLNVTGLPVGTIFQVFVAASDGVETSRTSFLVTVSA